MTANRIEALEIQSTFANGLRELRQRNCLRVLEALRFSAPLTPTEIARLTDLSRSTIWSVLRELEQLKLVNQAASNRSGSRRGRPGIMVSLNSERTEVLNAIDSIGNQGLHSTYRKRLARLIAENDRLSNENAKNRSALAAIAELAAKAYERPHQRRRRDRAPNRSR